MTINVMMKMKFYISSHLHKNLCSVEEYPYIIIVSLDVFTLREPQSLLLSHHHKNMTPLEKKKIQCSLKFTLIFWHLGYLALVDLLDVSLSYSLPKIPSLKDYGSEKYMFGSTCTMDKKTWQIRRKYPNVIKTFNQYQF